MWLHQGMQAGQAGDRAEARRCFEYARAADPDNTEALLWLAWLARDREESLALFGRVLTLDPDNERARAGARWARQPAQFPAQPAAACPENEPGAGERDVPSLPKAIRAAPLRRASPPRSLFWPVLGLLVAIALLIAAAWLAIPHLPIAIPGITTMMPPVPLPTGSSETGASPSPSETTGSRSGETGTPSAPAPSTSFPAATPTP